jgi:hypothetical protein
VLTVEGRVPFLRTHAVFPEARILDVHVLAAKIRTAVQRHLTGVARWAGVRRVLLLEAGSCGGGGGKKDGGSTGALPPGTSTCPNQSGGDDQPSIDQC